MATAYPDDEITSEGVFVYDNKPADPADTVDNGLDINDNEALSAEFRHRLGILDDDSDLTEAFKASIGILSGEGNMAVDEIIWHMEEERDHTISRFQFSKYLKDHLQKGLNGSWSKDPIKQPMLSKTNAVDKMASLAIFLAIQRFMGDNPVPPNVQKTKGKTPVMTRLYRTLEKQSRGGRKSSGGEVTNEDFKSKKRQSWKKIFKRSNSERESDSNRKSSTGGSDDLNYSSDLANMAASLPTDDLDLVHFIIGHGILRKELRDEIFCQLCKQLTGNPSTDSQLQGWILVSMCCSTFAPSPDLNKYFRCFLKDVTLEFKEYAGYARRMLRRIDATGMRYHPPNWLEFQAAKLKKYVLLPVSFADHSVQSVEADSATTASEICAKLCDKKVIRNSFGFSVFISIYDKVSSLGSGYDHVMDAISECEQLTRAKGKKEEDSPWRLFFRKEMFTPWHDPTFDAVSTHLIFKQICRGVRSEEYPCRSEEDLVKFLAQRLYVESDGQLIPGKIQQDLLKALPKSAVGEGAAKSRDGWTQAIMSYVQERGFVQKKIAAGRVRESMVYSAARRWPLQFSGLFEAYRLSGPRLAKNDIVLAVNCKGLVMMDAPYKVDVAHPYYEIVEASVNQTHKKKGQCFNLVTIKGEEYTFLSPNSETIVRLVTTFLEGLRQRSVYCIGLQNYVLQDLESGSSSAFNFGQGNFLTIVDEKPDPPRDDWVVGKCEANGTKGQFPLSSVYIIPTLESPPPEFMRMFQDMSKKDMDTLPRQKEGIVLSKGTIGRHNRYGKESAA